MCSWFVVICVHIYCLYTYLAHACSIYSYTYMRNSICACIYAYVHLHAHIYMYIQMLHVIHVIHIPIHIHVHVWAYVYEYLYMYMYMYICRHVCFLCSTLCMPFSLTKHKKRDTSGYCVWMKSFAFWYGWKHVSWEALTHLAHLALDPVNPLTQRPP